MTHKLSKRVQRVLRHSRDEALRLGHDAIGPEHLLMGILCLGEGMAMRIISYLGCNINDLRKAIEETIGTGSQTGKITDIPFTKRAERALRMSYIEGGQYNSELIGTEHLLLSLTKDEDDIVSQVLAGFNIRYDNIKNELESIIRDSESNPRQGEV